MAARDEEVFHAAQLRRCCRICGNLLCKSKKRATVYNCRDKNELLEKIGVTTKDDTTSTHPDSLCNSCNTRITRVGRGPSSTVTVFQWTPHSDTDCVTCRHFRSLSEGGRPKGAPRGRPPSAIESLLSSAHPSWGDLHPLSLERFSPPSHTVLLSDLQCNKCQCIVNRPVMTECSNLLCCTCAVEILQHREICPACRCHHTAPPISAGAVVVKVVGSLLVHCATCGSSIELKKMKEHLLSNCSQVLPPSPSQLTLGQMMACSADTPASDAERKLATALVKRISLSSSTSSVLTLPTAGQVKSTKCPMYV